MLGTLTTQLTPHLCPHCGTYLDAVSDPNGKARPKPGDMSVCLKCAGLCQFDANLQVRKLSREVLEGLDEVERAELDRVRLAAQETIMEMAIRGHTAGTDTKTRH